MAFMVGIVGIGAHSVVPALKRYFADQLPGVQWPAVRPPLMPIGDADYRALSAKLRALGFALS